jgi:FkbM family methyltransferase
MNASLKLLLPHVLSQLPDHAKPFAIDVGVYRGEFSRFLIDSRYFHLVLGFEPNLESYLAAEGLVCSTVGCEFKLINMALSSRPGILEFFCDGNAATSSLLQYIKGFREICEVQRSLVKVVRLDDFLDEYSVKGSLLCLKIDTQGNDLSVIEGSVRTIALHRPVIQAEFIYVPLYEGQCQPEEVTNYLSELNYRLYSLNNSHVNPEGGLCFCDAIFIPRELNIPITPKFHCIDDEISFHNQIQTLTEICKDRLSLINILDAEVKRLKSIGPNVIRLNTILSKLKSWVQ